MRAAWHLSGLWGRLLEGRVPEIRADAPGAAEAAARLFSAELVRASAASDPLIASMTQGACLDALFPR